MKKVLSIVELGGEAAQLNNKYPDPEKVRHIPNR
jgi:hypothetical protein